MRIRCESAVDRRPCRWRGRSAQAGWISIGRSEPRNSRCESEVSITFVKEEVVETPVDEAVAAVVAEPEVIKKGKVEAEPEAKDVKKK